MIAKRFQPGSRSAFVLLALALQGCIFSSGGGKKGAGPVYRGYYSFGNPTALSSLSLDSTYQVQWSASDSAGDGSVRLSLYKGDAFLGNLATALPADGPYAWSLSLSRSLGNYRFGSGSDYRLRVTNSSDSSKWDFSPGFSVYSRYTGTLALTAPAAGSQAKVDSTSTISWSIMGTVGTYVGLQLYKDTVLARTLTASATASAGSYSWLPSISPLGSGDDYHIRIFAANDPSIGQTGPAFRISSSWSGSFAFRSPGGDDTLEAGNTAKAAWTTSGNPGSIAQLSLWRDSALYSTVGTVYPGTSDSAAWLVPAGATSGRYRLRLASTSDPGIFAFSPYFYVSGVDPDDYEKDDSLKLAKPIGTDGKPQQHNLTLQDSDWLRFAAKAGKRYLVSLRANATVYLDVTDSAGGYLKEQSGTNIQIAYAPAYAGKHCLHVFPYSSTAPGPYQIAVTEYDSGAAPFKAAFSSPDSNSTWAAGSDYTVAWTPDTLAFGPAVTLSLYSDTTLVQSITSYTSNSGTYSWTLPAGLYSGDKYRIRMASYSNPSVFAYGPRFALSGATPDAYEPDNSRGAAKAISADGSVQQRNIMTNDTDWVRFDGPAGKTYLAAANAGSAYVYFYFTDSAGTVLASQSGSRISLSYSPARDGKYFLRIQGYSGAGPYALSLLAYETGKGGVPVKFTAPDSGTVWSAGSLYTVSWTPDSLIFGTTVTLALYNDSTFVQYLTSYVANAGTFSWSIPVGLYSGNKYRIRMAAYSNSALFGYGPYFTIAGTTPDAYEPDNSRGAAQAISADGAAQQHNIVASDTDWVRFDGAAGKTYLASVNSSAASVYLYVTDSLGNALASQTGSRISVAYTPARAGKYYVRVQYYSGAGAYTLSLNAYDAGQGGLPVKFTSPDTGTVWSSGSAYPVAWAPDTALFGTYVTLGLYLDNAFLYNLSTYAANSGSVSVTLPTGLATGKGYRLRLANYSNPSVYGSSRPFSIAGTPPDSLEPNDTLTAAKAIVPNAPRRALSLSYKDKDWFAFPAKAQKLYLIQATSAASLTTVLRLWPATGASYLLSSTKSTLDSLNSLAWVASADGDYLISVEGSSASYYGPYGFELKEVDPSSYKFTVSAPAADAGFKAGGTLSVQWADPASVKGYVDLFLYDGDGVVQTIAANVSNTGSYSWIVPSGLPARSDYFVKVISRLSSGISGSSEAFSIAP